MSGTIQALWIIPLVAQDVPLKKPVEEIDRIVLDGYSLIPDNIFEQMAMY